MPSATGNHANASAMTIPRTDALKPRPRLGTPARSQQPQKLVENTTDADKLKTVPISTTLPTIGQVLMHDGVQYVPSNVAAAVTATGAEAPVSVFSAQELVYAAANIRFQGPLSSAAGDINFSPGGIMRAEMYANAHDGGAIQYGPTQVDLATNITITTSPTAISISAIGPANGQHIRIDSEAMLVISGGGTTTLTVARGRLQTTAATHNAPADVLRVNVESVMQVTGGFRATGGVANQDLALQGYSTHELEIRATFTEPIALYADGQTEFGYMTLYRGGHDHVTDVNYAVEIDTHGAPGVATFRWSDDGGATWIASLVSIPSPGAFIGLQNGVTISFSHGTYFVGNRWEFTAIAVPDQVELLRADTVNDVLHVRNVSIVSTTDAYTRNLEAIFTYTGASPNVANVYLSTTYEGVGGLGSEVVGADITAQANSAGAVSSVIGTRISVGTEASQAGAVAGVVGLTIGRTWNGAIPAVVEGLAIGNLGNAATDSVIALDIAAQTAAVSDTRNIYQRGTTGINTLAAATLVGADAPPLAGLAFEVTGDMAVSSQLLVGASALPAAGVALELRNGAFRMAAGTDGVIQNANGDARLSFDQDSTFVGTEFGGVGLSGASGHLALFGYAGGAGVVDVPFAAYFFLQTTDASLGQVAGGFFDLAYSGTSAIAVVAGGIFWAETATGAGAVTDLTGAIAQAGGAQVVSPTNFRAFWAKNSAAWTAAIKPGTAYGVDIENMGRFLSTSTQVPTVYGARIQGQRAATLAVGLLVQAHVGGPTTAIGIDVEAQTAGAGGIGVRIAASDVYALQLSSTAGTAAGGITFGVDANLYRSGADVLKTDDKLWIVGELELDGDLNHDGANVGFYGVAPVAQPSAYTQTYATADKTHAAFTSADLAAFTGGSVGFLDAAERDSIRTEFNALRADVADAKQLANSIIDDLQALGLVA